MATKLLSQEQIDTLKKSPYVIRVTPTKISFSKEFKEAFWDLHKQGYSMTRCFALLGFNSNVLSKSRMISTYQTIQREAGSSLGFTDINQPKEYIRKTYSNHQEMSNYDVLQKMQAEMIHMQEEIDSLKKALELDKQVDCH